VNAKILLSFCFLRCGFARLGAHLQYSYVNVFCFVGWIRVLILLINRIDHGIRF
jgi:hypothetical protein